MRKPDGQQLHLMPLVLWCCWWGDRNNILPRKACSAISTGFLLTQVQLQNSHWNGWICVCII